MRQEKEERDPNRWHPRFVETAPLHVWMWTPSQVVEPHADCPAVLIEADLRDLSWWMWLVLHRSQQILAGWFCLVNPKADFLLKRLQQRRPQVYEVLISNRKHRKPEIRWNQMKRDTSDRFRVARCYLMHLECTWNARGMHWSDLSGGEAHDSDGYHRGLHRHSVLSSEKDILHIWISLDSGYFPGSCPDLAGLRRGPVNPYHVQASSWSNLCHQPHIATAHHSTSQHIIPWNVCFPNGAPVRFCRWSMRLYLRCWPKWIRPHNLYHGVHDLCVSVICINLMITSLFPYIIRMTCKDRYLMGPKCHAELLGPALRHVRQSCSRLCRHMKHHEAIQTPHTPKNSEIFVEML